MIKRYEFEQPTRDSICDSEYEYMNESPKGDYVKYSNHIEVVKDLLEDLWHLARTLEYKDDPVSLHHSKQYQEKYMNLIKEYGL